MNKGKGNQGGGGNSDPPDEAHREIVKSKMIGILSQYGQPTNQMDVEGIEAKIYAKVMKETKTKDQYNKIIQQLMASLKQKTEQASLKMNAGQPGQLNQNQNQNQQGSMSQGLSQSLRPNVPPQMAQQLIGGLAPSQQQNQQQSGQQQTTMPQMQGGMIPVSMAGGPGQMIMNNGQMPSGQGMGPGMMGPGQGMAGSQGQMMGGPPPGVNIQMMQQSQGMMGPRGPMNQQQMGMNQQQMGVNQQQMGINQQQMGINQQQMGMNQQQDPMSALKTMAPDGSGPQPRMSMPGPPPGHGQGNDLRPVFSPQTRFNNPNSPQVSGQWTPGQGPGMAPSPRPMLGPGPGQLGPGSNTMPSGMSPMPAYFNSSLNTPASIPIGNSPSAPSPGPPPQQSYGPLGMSGPIGPGPNGPDPYLMKLQELAKYIDPLRSMIRRIESDTSKADSKEFFKIKQLLEIISNQSNQRVPYETLRKCEDALENMNLKMKSNSDQREQQQIMQQQGIIHSAHSQHITIHSQSNHITGSNIFQPLLDAFKEGLKRPNFPSFLSKTFGPAVAALGITPPSERSEKNVCIAGKKRTFTDDINDNSLDFFSRPIKERSPNSKSVIEGEIARLDAKFKIQPDPLSHPGSDATQVIATLDSDDLPYVPPVIIQIPSTYPLHPPTLIIDDANDQLINPLPFAFDSEDFNEFDAEEHFFKRVREKLNLNLEKLPKMHSLTALLQSWEMSVRQACNEKSV